MFNNINTNLPIHDNAGIMEVVSKKYLPDNRTTADVLLQSLSVSFPVVSFNYHHKMQRFINMMLMLIMTFTEYYIILQGEN